MEQPNTNLFDLQVDMQATMYLRDAAKWAKFLAITGFVFCGFIAIAGIATASILGRASSAFGSSYAMGSSIMVSIIYVGMAVVYFFPCLYLLRFSSKMNIALLSNDQLEMNNSFSNLKSCFRFLGILTIIMLGFFALSILSILATAIR